MKLRIGLDIDGVVADSFPVFTEELNRQYGKNIMEIDNYDMSKIYDVDWNELDTFFDKNMEVLFSTPEPVKGSVESIVSLTEAGHEIIYVTARKPGAEELITKKWLEEKQIPPGEKIFTGGLSKTIAVKEHGIDVFVDDFISNSVEIVSMGIPVLLMDAPYNRGNLPEGVIRCYDWNDVVCHIEQFSRNGINW